jgi:hypothetical protein
VSTVTATGLHAGGSSEIYVRLWYPTAATTWQYIDAQFTAAEGDAKPVITSPSHGTLAGSSDTFSWIGNGAGATQYRGY